jgi:hypothetical protein
VKWEVQGKGHRNSDSGLWLKRLVKITSFSLLLNQNEVFVCLFVFPLGIEGLWLIASKRELKSKTFYIYNKLSNYLIHKDKRMVEGMNSTMIYLI